MGDHYAEDEANEEISIDASKIQEDIDKYVQNKLTTEAAKWNAKKVDAWGKDVIEFTLKSLAEMKKPFKFIVTCTFMQKTGAGLTASFNALWDNSRDGTFSMKNENDAVVCVTTVYWVKID